MNSLKLESQRAQSQWPVGSYGGCQNCRRTCADSIVEPQKRGFFCSLGCWQKVKDEEAAEAKAPVGSDTVCRNCKRDSERTGALVPDGGGFFICRECWEKATEKKAGEELEAAIERRQGAVKPDSVNHPAHYTGHASGTECIEIVEHMGFCLGNAIKYIWRADLKGNAVEDLRKAKWYLEREIAKRENSDERRRKTVS